VDERDTFEQEKEQLAKQIEDTQDKVCHHHHHHHHPSPPPTTTAYLRISATMLGRDQLILIKRNFICPCTEG
jgi:hypothetical protein